MQKNKCIKASKICLLSNSWMINHIYFVHPYLFYHTGTTVTNQAAVWKISSNKIDIIGKQTESYFNGRMRIFSLFCLSDDVSVWIYSSNKMKCVMFIAPSCPCHFLFANLKIEPHLICFITLKPNFPFQCPTAGLCALPFKIHFSREWLFASVANKNPFFRLVKVFLCKIKTKQ